MKLTSIYWSYQLLSKVSAFSFNLGIQHMKFSVCSVVPLKQLSWTNNLMILFDGVLNHFYMFVHIIDKVQFVEVVIKHVRDCKHVNLRSSPSIWFEKGTNEQFLLSFRSPCKLSNSSNLAFLESVNLNSQHCFFRPLCFHRQKKFLKKAEQVWEKRTILTSWNQKSWKLAGNPFSH